MATTRPRSVFLNDHPWYYRAVIAYAQSAVVAAPLVVLFDLPGLVVAGFVPNLLVFRQVKRLIDDSESGG
ncbi:MAG: hypothetical protein ABEI75_02530 [Halobaculum sp.]